MSGAGLDLGAFERLLSEEEVIDVLGLRQRPNPGGALRWLIRVGRLAVVRLGKGVNAFKRQDVAACIEACRVSAGVRE